VRAVNQGVGIMLSVFDKIGHGLSFGGYLATCYLSSVDLRDRDPKKFYALKIIGAVVLAGVASTLLLSDSTLMKCNASAAIISGILLLQKIPLGCLDIVFGKSEISKQAVYGISGVAAFQVINIINSSAQLEQHISKQAVCAISGFISGVASATAFKAIKRINSSTQLEQHSL
jgi:hypothetical protein